jgi:phosphonate transport system substrate-binding protein
LYVFHFNIQKFSLDAELNNNLLLIILKNNVNMFVIKNSKKLFLVAILFIIFCKKEYIGFSEPTFIYDSYPLNPPEEKADLYFSSVPYKNFLELASDYQPLLNYLNQTLSIKILYKPIDQYYKVYDLLKNEKIDIALIDPYYYRKHKNEFDLEILAELVYTNTSSNYFYLVNRNDQFINNLGDIKKNISILTISFDNPYSFVGYQFPNEFLQRNELNLKRFKNVNYSGNFESTVQGILSGNFDLGFVDALTYEKYKATAIGLKVLYRSEPLEHYVLVIRKNLDETLKRKIRNSLLELSINNDQQKSILQSIHKDLIGFR